MYHNGHLIWYAVAVYRPGDYVDHGTGSYNKRDALRMANNYKRNPMYDGYTIQIDIVDPKDDYTIDTLTIRP